MKKSVTEAEYIAELEAQIASITEAYNTLSDRFSIVSNERDSFSQKCDNLESVILKMSDELRNLRRMLFGRKSERFIPEDPSQLSLSFDGVEQLDEEREAEVIQAKEVPQVALTPKKAKSEDKRERRVFAEHLERRDEIIEPESIPDGSKRIGEEVTELVEYTPGSCIFVV